jgi:hypothetical protein
MDLDWNLLVVARTAGMLAEFGMERRGKSREKQTHRERVTAGCAFPFPFPLTDIFPHKFFLVRLRGEANWNFGFRIATADFVIPQSFEASIHVSSKSEIRNSQFEIRYVSIPKHSIPD